MHARVLIIAGAVIYLAGVAFTLLLLSANKAPQDTEVTDASSLTDGENSPHTDQP